MTTTLSDEADTRRAFRQAVNMTPRELERWLDSDRSKNAGQKKSPKSETTGHASGRRIVGLRRRTIKTYTRDNYAFMTKVVGYVKRHGAQRPDGDVTDTRWRFSLMNWGHDPNKTVGLASTTAPSKKSGSSAKKSAKGKGSKGPEASTRKKSKRKSSEGHGPKGKGAKGKGAKKKGAKRKGAKDKQSDGPSSPKKKIWERPNPKRKHQKMSRSQKKEAKRSAKKQGRDRPSLVDNVNAMK